MRGVSQDETSPRILLRQGLLEPYVGGRICSLQLWPIERLSYMNVPWTSWFINNTQCNCSLISRKWKGHTYLNFLLLKDHGRVSLRWHYYHFHIYIWRGTADPHLVELGYTMDKCNYHKPHISGNWELRLNLRPQTWHVDTPPSIWSS